MENLRRNARKLVDTLTVYTHGGVFHADDVFSAALLDCVVERYNEETRDNLDYPQVLRVFKVTPEQQEENIVFDIGGGEFDHHQEIESRENGIPYAAFGKLWRVFGTYLVSEKSAKAIDDSLVQAIDAQDNGVESNPLSMVISHFNPKWDDDETTDTAFERARAFARQILADEIRHALSIERAESAVHKAASIRETPEILVLENYVPYVSTVQDSYQEVCFVVYPSLRGGWNCNTVPNPGEKQGKVLFPQEWLGITNKELGITFCHIGNFLLSTETKEQAVNCAKIAIDRKE